MEPEIIIAIVAVVLIAGVLAALAWRKRQTDALRDRFGPEYERTIDLTGDRHEAEQELRERERRRDSLSISPLPAESRARYVDEWRSVQAQFVDAPVAATREAHALITIVMRERGYPMEDFEQRAADISVDHPQVVEDYRSAHRITQDAEEGRAGTEDLRQAMVHYRSLFDRLLEAPADADRQVR